ncbi:MAG: DNA polymerase III subunit tau [Alphaproteobacteria bacterium MarineAlpha6_Bin5]|nr:MAG: DNA polymerase III subunit tau [Alphaproteobacteria bacterium MarineAlpha6_Bin5]|tara:strand:+ start:204 stop:1850 length:1647 start_codon:yes stop_codon:yes gene_type:complete
MTEPFLALARKYRPKKLSELIGQDVFVSTIQNAIKSNRLAHAYLFSGVRGVGKTTTARILAHLFNGEDEVKGNPLDLFEVDAARYTTVDTIRELLDGIKYRPSNWKYKIYILDEVHMLSTSAVSSLLKNLEEPPEHVKFIFCTTEPRKIPATIISRCQRFDLKRVPFDTLANYLIEIAKKEKSDIDINASSMIARASDGSVRDALSILDKSLSIGEKKITEKQVQELLGLVDRTNIFLLFENLLNKKTKESLELFNNLYNSGADPSVIIQDLLEVVHWVTRLILTPEISNEPGVSQIDKEKGTELSKQVDASQLSIFWQILLKGYQELQNHDMPHIIAEMIFVRLTYSSELSLSNNIEINKKEDSEKISSETVVKNKQESSTNENKNKSGISSDTVMEMKNIETLAKKSDFVENNKQTLESKNKLAIGSFKELTNLFLKKKEILLFNNLFSHVHLVKFSKGRIVLNPTEDAPKDLANKVSQLLNDWTGEKWHILMTQEKGDLTLEEQSDMQKAKIIDDFSKDEKIKEILNIFPESKIEEVKKEGENNE